MTKSIYKYLFIVILLCNNTAWCTSEKSEVAEPWITIFVHGIIGLDAKTCLSNAFQFFTDHILNTVYAKSVEYMREDPFFTQNQAMQGKGLVAVDLDNFNKGYGAAAVALCHQHITSLCPSNQKNYYYTYGWSGLLSFKARYQDAKNLYSTLLDIMSEFKKQGINPKLRLIGYSHGANICLNLGLVHAESLKHSLTVDELILLGAPIQRETEKHVASPLFKKIYSFYSRSDCVQKKDMFTSQQFFSKRVFSNRHEFSLPATLTQIEVKILVENKTLNKKRKRKKTTQEDPIKINHAADITDHSIVKGRSWLLKNMSPGHSELWFMSWTPRNYREDFPLYPAPVVAFTPYIIQLIEKTTPPQTTSRHLVVDIRPDYNYMVMRHRYPTRHYTAISFVPQKTFDNLKTLSLPYKPDNYTKEVHDIHRAQAKEKAYEDRKKQVRAKRENRGKKQPLIMTSSQHSQHTDT